MLFGLYLIRRSEMINTNDLCSESRPQEIRPWCLRDLLSRWRDLSLSASCNGIVAVIVTVRKYVHFDFGEKTPECSVVRVPADYLAAKYHNL